MTEHPTSGIDDEIDSSLLVTYIHSLREENTMPHKDIQELDLGTE